MSFLRRLFRRDRIVLHRVDEPGHGPVMYAANLPRGARAGTRIILKD